MATGPQIETDPIKLLTRDPSREEPFMDKLWGALLFGSMTFAGYCVANNARKIPVFSGMPRNILYTGAAAGLGYWIDRIYRPAYFAERDAKWRHYISLHPEDFHPEGRKKFADVFEPWVPIR